MRSTTLQQIQWASVVILPIAVIWIFELIYFTLFIDLSFMEELSPRIIRTVLAVLPILILILFTQSRLKKQPFDEVRRGLTSATITVLLSMTIVWGIYVLQFFTRILGGKGVGSAMWLALIIFPSPIYVPILMFIAYAIGQTSKRGYRNQILK